MRIYPTCRIAAGLALLLGLGASGPGCQPRECVGYNDCPQGQYCNVESKCVDLAGTGDGDGDGDVGGGDGDGDGDGRPNQLATDETLLLEGLVLTDDGYASFSDPQIVKVDDAWTILFSAFRFEPEPAEVHILSAWAESLDAPASSWTIPRNASGAIVPAFQPTHQQGDWDASVVQNAEVVYGWDATADEFVLRLYYTGFSLYDNDDEDVAIGCATWDENAGVDGDWVRCGSTPVLEGIEDIEMTNGRSQVSDPTVIYEAGNGANGADGTWHMYYLGLSMDLGRLSVIHATSDDGLSWNNRSEVAWSGPMAPPNMPAGPIGPTVRSVGGQVTVVGWQPYAGELRRQGLYRGVLSGPGETLSSTWEPLVYEDSLGTGWHYTDAEGAECHKTGLFNADIIRDGNQTWLFYAGVKDTTPGDSCSDAASNRIGSIGRARLP